MLEDAAQYVLAPERDVRASLQQSDKPLTFSVLVPPFAALGVGVLRVLRIRETDTATELVAGYERYERHQG